MDRTRKLVSNCANGRWQGQFGHRHGTNVWLALGPWLEAEALVRGIYAIAYEKAAE